jgi:hypothetical protein
VLFPPSTWSPGSGSLVFDASPLFSLSLSLLAPKLAIYASSRTNAARLVQSRLGRALTRAEDEALDEGLVEAFSLLTTGSQTQRAATLQLVAFTTLSTPAGAQLWASLLEVATTPVAEGGNFSVNGFVSALINALSAIAGAQLAASSLF